jgi:hypothetical protein
LNVGSRRKPLVATDPEYLDLAGSKRRQRKADADRHQLDVAGDDIGERGRRPAIMD